MRDLQDRVASFCVARDWEQYHNPKDLLLGIVEEVAELRNVIKWEQRLSVLHKTLRENREEVEDNIGDILWFVALLANQAGVDMHEALQIVISKNETRFPVDVVKSNHTNLYLGGKDGQYQDLA